MPEGKKDRVWNFHLSEVKKNGSCTLKAIDWECPINTFYVKGGYLAELAGVASVAEISLNHKFKITVKA